MYFPRLRDLREDKDLRQQDIADYLHISQTIPLVHLLRLADFYGTSTDYILGRTNVLRPYPPKPRI